MSGICGAWALDGSDADLGPVLAKLERRGPDGTRQWRGGPVALGHTLLATTPESLVEQLPLTDPASGCTITADVRLDNRDELFTALGLGGETRTIGDGELIVRAYLKWGDACPTHLFGDFAFAIWDPRERRLFCARDHMGMRQLIYHHAPGQLFAFATEAEALVAHSGVPKRINEGRIADYLDDMEGLDFTSTFFEEVFRLPPAHTLVVDGDSLELRRYWALTPEPELQLDSDQAYADAFLKVFTEAVRCRLRSAGPVGSMLSGGMDSGAVVAIASRLLAAGGANRLHTFSAVGPDPTTCIETRMIHASSKLPGLAPHLVDYDDLDADRAELQKMVEQSSDLFDADMSMVRALYLSAHRIGVKVVLDGAGGDVVLIPGNPIARSLRRGRLIEAIREMRGQSRFWGSSWNGRTAFASAAWAAFAPHSVRRLRRRLIWRREDRRALSGRGPFSAAFAAKVDIARRRDQFRQHISDSRPSEPGYRVDLVNHPHLAVARERYDRVASALAVEPRDPFLDLRVIRFCLSLPSNQLELHGWPKIILRRAMANRLPETVIWRSGKEHLGWAFTQSVLKQWPGWHESDGKNNALGGFVARHLLTELGETDNRPRFALAILSNWLKRNAMN